MEVEAPAFQPAEEGAMAAVCQPVASRGKAAGGNEQARPLTAHAAATALEVRWDGDARTTDFRVPLSWTVRDLKKSLQPRLQTAIDEQRLFYGTEELPDYVTIADVLEAIPQESPRSPRSPSSPRSPTSAALTRGFDVLDDTLRIANRTLEQVEWLNHMKLRTTRFTGSAPLAVKTDKDIVLLAVRNDGLQLQYAMGDARKDREVILSAVEEDPRALQYACAQLRADREVVLAAVERDGKVLVHANHNLRADREVALAAVRQDGWALHRVSKELQEDREVVTAAVSSRGRALAYAGAFVEDKDVVLAAVESDGLALEYACPALQADPNVVVVAARQNAHSLRFAAPPLRTHRIMILVASGQSKASRKATWEELLLLH